MKVLVDAVLPASIAHEAPRGIDYARWAEGDQPDDALVKHAAQNGFTAVLFYGREALLQSSVTRLATELGIVVLTVDAKDPIEARDYVFRHTNKIRDVLTRGSEAVINSSGVHSPFALGMRRAPTRASVSYDCTAEAGNA